LPHTKPTLKKTKELKRQRQQVCGKKSQQRTMYKNNSGLIAKTKVSKYIKGLC